MSEKRIEVVTLRPRDLKTGFGNPRKIRKQGIEDLEQSFDMFGDFGLFLIDEENNVIAGNQRLAVLKKRSPDQEILCKRLIGYSKAELRAINIKDNTHSGEWDLGMLAEWTADLNIDFGIEPKEQNPDERKISDMELIRYERYDYVMLVCRNEVDYKDLCRRLGIEGKKVAVTNQRKIHARAIWYDDVKAQIISSDNAEVASEDKVIDEEEKA